MKRILFAIQIMLASALPMAAQLMPQDNWRASGLQFGSPTNNDLRSIAAGTGGVYVGEVNGVNPTQVLQFTEAGAFVRRFAADFGYIHGIACDASGNVYVLSRGITRVRKFDANGTFIREWGQYGSGDGQFILDGATGNSMISVNQKTGEVFVCDPGNSRIVVFDSDGNFLRKWGEAGALPGQFPSGMPSVLAVSDKGDVMVGKSTGGTDPMVRVFDANGNYLKGSNPEWKDFSSNSFAVSPDGLLALHCAYWNDINSDSWYQRISVLDPGENYNNIDGIPSHRAAHGSTFSRRGDFYSIYGNRVTKYIREYSYASNFPAAPAIPHAMILNAGQRAGSNLVDIDYQVRDDDSASVTTAMLAVRDGDTKNRTGYSVPMRSFVEGTSAHVGENQPTGVTRHVVWNMPADWAIDYANFEIEILAKDSRDPLGVHWITVPAEGGNPAIQVSSAPIGESQLRDLWLWYLANGMVNQTYNNSGNGWLGTIWGKSGAYTGIKLAEDYNHPWEFRSIPTTAGRAYAFGQIGAHPITPAELVRAQTGKYGFSSVDSNSIVKNLAPTSSFMKGWGRNDYGQSSWQSFSEPNISKISSAHLTTFFTRADGTLWAVGYNHQGQLGDGTTTARTGPIQIATGVTEVATGGNHTLFVKTDGSLWAMGLNDNGQLGDGTTTNRLTPVQIASNVSQVACGSQHSFYLTTDGKLYGMGRNSEGQLGDSSTTARSTPVLVASDVIQIAAGMYHSLFIKNDGTLYAMGYNNYGQLGDGTTNDRSTPVLVASDVAQVSASCGDDQGHSVFVKTNGQLWAMGRNTHGQLGDGTTTNRSTPVQIDSNVSRAVAGSLHTVYLKTDKTAWSTGNNGNGQLGDNTTSNRSTPAQFDVNISVIAAGSYHSLATTIP
jgi:alpha-tubulin suppressor-like RCC1 family protein